MYVTDPLFINQLTENKIMVHTFFCYTVDKGGKFCTSSLSLKNSAGRKKLLFTLSIHSVKIFRKAVSHLSGAQLENEKNPPIILIAFCV